MVFLAAPFILPGCALAQSAAKPAETDAEGRVINYIRGHLRPGQPLLVTELYNNVFTQPDERQALDKLYNAFFRIPLFVAQYEAKFSAPPSLDTISQQFDLHAPGAAEVLLRVMEADPRVPQFLTRDPKTGEITHVEVERIRSDPKFGRILEHQLAGWDGHPAPAFSLQGLDGKEVDSARLAGKTVLLYVWFTGCPPCIKETPVLVDLERAFSGRGLEIIGANADRVLGLSYGDDVRRRYAREHQIDFPIVYWTRESDADFGSISIFPTLFLIDRKGVIKSHWVGFVSGEELRKALEPEIAN